MPQAWRNHHPVASADTSPAAVDLQLQPALAYGTGIHPLPGQIRQPVVTLGIGEGRVPAGQPVLAQHLGQREIGVGVLDPDGAVEEIKKAAENGFDPEPIYVERMRNFYYPLENCAEALYNEVSSWDCL